MRDKFLCNLIVFIALAYNLSESRDIRKKKLSDQFPDYEASGDYFEVTVNNKEHDVTADTTTMKKATSSSEETSSDDGVTCSQSNITEILAGYELENHVLVIFKVNVTANERELVL